MVRLRVLKPAVKVSWQDELLEAHCCSPKMETIVSINHYYIKVVWDGLLSLGKCLSHRQQQVTRVPILTASHGQRQLINEYLATTVEPSVRRF